MKVPDYGMPPQAASGEQPSQAALLMAAAIMDKQGKPPTIFGSGGNPNFPPLKPIDPEAWKAYGISTGQRPSK